MSSSSSEEDFVDSDDLADLREAEFGISSVENVENVQKPDFQENMSIGAAMMRKMGYLDGQGLGAAGQGIVDPIEAKKLQKGAGIKEEAIEDDNIKKIRYDIESEISLLTNARNLLETGYEMNLSQFISQLCGTKLWLDPELELYNAAADVFVHQMDTIAANDLHEQYSLFLLCQWTFPLKTWESTLSRCLIPKLKPLMSTYDISQTVDVLESLKSTIVPVLPKILALQIPINESNMDNLLRIYTREEIYNKYYNEVLGQINSIEDQEIGTLISRFPQSVLAGKLINSRTADEAYTKLKNYNALIPETMKYHVHKPLLAELAQLLNSRKLSQDWCEKWKQRLSKQEYEIVLNLINVSMSSNLACVDDVSFKDVVVQYCLDNGYTLHQAGSSYTLSMHKKKVLCTISGDILFLVVNQKQYPISLDDLNQVFNEMD